MLKLKNLKVYDPVNGVNGEIKDICMEDGLIVSDNDKADEIRDMSGHIAMAGAIDIHTHIAGEPLPFLRDADNPLLAPSQILGEQYLGLGYTVAVNAAMCALNAREAILEENAIKDLDIGNLVWVGENPLFTKLINEESKESNKSLPEYLSWLLSISGALGLKLINPCGGQSSAESSYHKTIDKMIDATMDLRLAHPLHLHHPFLGSNIASDAVCETIKAAAGRPLHLAHLQFYGYTKNSNDETISAAEKLADAINSNPNITCDVGAVTFGEAAAVTADLEFGEKFGKSKKGFVSTLWEADGGFCVLPMKYSAKNRMNATQFLTGLELMLLVKDPSRICLTTDFPNGGSFLAYPYLIHLLMDKSFRDEELKKLNSKALATSAVPSIKREYSYYEIAQMTRSGPAKLLGFSGKGHLGIGANGGLSCYKEMGNKEDMFRNPAACLKGKKELLSAPKIEYNIDFVKKLTEGVYSVAFEDLEDVHSWAQSLH
ncbi:MAG: amidohydrolase family protein [Lachnospiraceae bacterium]|jgi:formylmethanofuran dehydrogenase subunit A|nr:amidohydrolase family protein [Lachnospiraceae bacterium]